MIRFVLHDPRVHAGGRPLDRVPLDVESPVADFLCAAHDAPQTGKRQTPFPVFFRFLPDRLDHGVDKHGLRNRTPFAQWIFGFEPEADHAKVDADLRSGKAAATFAIHGVPKIARKSAQFGRAEFANRNRGRDEVRIPHSKNGTLHGDVPFRYRSAAGVLRASNATNAFAMSTTETTASATVSLSASKSIPSFAVPIPAA